MAYKYLLLSSNIITVIAYSHNIYKLLDFNDNSSSDTICGTAFRDGGDMDRLSLGQNDSDSTPTATEDNLQAITYATMSFTEVLKDPLEKYQQMIHQFLYGPKVDESIEEDFSERNKEKGDDDQGNIKLSMSISQDLLAHYPMGNVMRAEMFLNKTAVHMPLEELVHKGHCYLNMTKDYMQTAVDAFSIFVEGNVDDIMRLPSSYVLFSTRTIAMMKIAREKYVATWTVVKGDMETAELSPYFLELYRPLFKYLSGKEIAKLNLSDPRIVSYIGTHADLDRHQVGVVASKYIKMNPDWSEPKYLNLMNNLLCGIPMTFMRKIPENTYLQLTHQTFYHIRACDPLQRRFYLATMTRTQALGKSYSWSARDVSRLGLLLAELEGSDLAAINPEAMSGLTSQVMLEMPPHNLQYITEMQLRYIRQKPLNILARKLRAYKDQQQLYDVAVKNTFNNILVFFIMCTVPLFTTNNKIIFL